jgi:hypothetical protein
MDILSDVMPVNIIVNIKLRNRRMYEVAWAIAKLRRYETLDDFINDAVLDAIEMVPDGTGGPGISDIEWGFKTRWGSEKEQGKQAKISQ